MSLTKGVLWESFIKDLYVELFVLKSLFRQQNQEA